MQINYLLNIGTTARRKPFSNSSSENLSTDDLQARSIIKS